MVEKLVVTSLFHNKFMQGYMNHIGFPKLFCFLNQGSFGSDRNYSVLAPCSLTLPKTAASLCKLQHLEKRNVSNPEEHFNPILLLRSNILEGSRFLVIPKP